MSMVETVRSAVQQGWTALGDLIQTVTYHHISRGEAQPDGTVPQTVTSEPVEMAIFDYRLSLPGYLLSRVSAGDDVQVGDQQGLTLAHMVTIKPENGDRVTDAKGIVYNVIRVLGDERFAYELHLRR